VNLLTNSISYKKQVKYYKNNCFVSSMYNIWTLENIRSQTPTNWWSTIDWSLESWPSTRTNKANSEKSKVMNLWLYAIFESFISNSQKVGTRRMIIQLSTTLEKLKKPYLVLGWTKYQDLVLEWTKYQDKDKTWCYNEQNIKIRTKLLQLK